MQKWEYLFVGFTPHNNTQYPWAVNGHEIKNWKQGVTLVEYCNELGEQGWELVGEAEHTGCLIFKRPEAE